MFLLPLKLLKKIIATTSHLKTVNDNFNVIKYPATVQISNGVLYVTKKKNLFCLDCLNLDLNKFCRL